MLKVKICGIMRAEDARLATDAGADVLGMIFVAGSKRLVDRSQAARIIEVARTGDKRPQVAGLFADQPEDEVNGTVAELGLDVVQLCGGESPAYCARMRLPVMKTVHVAAEAVDCDELSGKIRGYTEDGHVVVVDRKVEGLAGGTGKSFDWNIARDLSERGIEFFLAGGLTPDNVEAAVQLVRPWGVDVSSGVETTGAAGKDQQKIRSFIKAAREAQDYGGR